jgi:hypothetical protein
MRPRPSLKGCRSRQRGIASSGANVLRAQRPRLVTRSICLYIDPYTVSVDPNFRFAELGP